MAIRVRIITGYLSKIIASTKIYLNLFRRNKSEETFEVSIRGSLYFYLSTISEQQVSQLQQFANQFYRSNSAYKYRADDEIMECFTISVKQKFDIELERIPVTAVLVIK